AALPGAVAYAATVLQASGRASDAIGDLSEGAFAVLAPATPPEHALKMARRLSLVIETAGPRPAGVPPLRVHAGYDAAANVHESPIEPGRLLEHAGTALDQARAAGPGERIRAYREWSAKAPQLLHQLHHGPLVVLSGVEQLPAHPPSLLPRDVVSLEQ